MPVLSCPREMTKATLPASWGNMANSIGFASPMLEGEATIVIEIHNSQPLDLLELTASLTALAKEHEAAIRERTPSILPEETRLLVVDVRKGSIILELVPALAPFVSTAEFINTAIDFVEKLKNGYDALKKVGGRLTDPSVQRLKNFSDAVQTIASDAEGRLRVFARHKEKGVLQEIVIEKEDAQRVIENAQHQRLEIESISTAPLLKVLMQLYQTSADSPKIGKRNPEKGIIERVDMTPRPLVYVSDQAGARIKDEMLNSDANAYKKRFYRRRRCRNCWRPPPTLPHYECLRSR